MSDRVIWSLHKGSTHAKSSEHGKKIIKEVAPSVCGEKNNSWCKELQDASLPSDKMGNDRKQLFTLLTAKETYSPCSRVWKPPDAALFSHFHIFVHATSESFSIFTEGGEESTKASNVYIFFFLARGCWMNFNHDHEKKEKEKSAVFDVRNLWNFLLLRRNCNVWPLWRLCMINISLFWNLLGL